jgi:hypothetical protein
MGLRKNVFLNKFTLSFRESGRRFLGFLVLLTQTAAIAEKIK